MELFYLNLFSIFLCFGMKDDGIKYKSSDCVSSATLTFLIWRHKNGFLIWMTLLNFLLLVLQCHFTHVLLITKLSWYKIQNFIFLFYNFSNFYIKNFKNVIILTSTWNKIISITRETATSSIMNHKITRGLPKKAFIWLKHYTS